MTLWVSPRCTECSTEYRVVVLNIRGFHVNLILKTHKYFRNIKDKLHVTAKDKKDEMVQAGASEIDPQQWTGNQRVLHFGPMAQRDPYFYYYPKGWDILYPATFGFFPYRTSLVF